MCAISLYKVTRQCGSDTRTNKPMKQRPESQSQTCAHREVLTDQKVQAKPLGRAPSRGTTDQLRKGSAGPTGHPREIRALPHTTCKHKF